MFCAPIIHCTLIAKISSHEQDRTPTIPKKLSNGNTIHWSMHALNSLSQHHCPSYLHSLPQKVYATRLRINTYNSRSSSRRCYTSTVSTLDLASRAPDNPSLRYILTSQSSNPSPPDTTSRNITSHRILLPPFISITRTSLHRTERYHSTRSLGLVRRAEMMCPKLLPRCRYATLLTVP